MTTAENMWTHQHECTLPAPPDRVFTALTQASELQRWFAEHALVDVRPGGRFQFWGKHTYGAPPEPDERQQVTRLEANRVLGFRWPFEGLESEVVLTLTPAAESNATQLLVEHHFDRTSRSADIDAVDDLWRLTTGNLAAHLRGGDGIVLVDYTDDSPEIRTSIVIDAPPDRVFRALIDPAVLNTWIATAAEVEPHVGGRYSYGWNYQHGGRDVTGGPTRILELVPNERLVTDWPDWRGDPRKPPTRVAWLIEPFGSKTRVTVVHGEFPRAVDISDYPFGWRGFLDQLKTAMEGSAS
ncbi:MAG TPA: SRPBCC family protein [Vicinamibacterales bacterium]|jgi:uncharacterized protein YndB with AHSA1/START domain